MAACLTGLMPFAAAAEVEAPTRALGSLQGVQPPLPFGELDYAIADMGWLRVLGKALFWEQNIGSDGQACASCHFAAGADTRITNVLSPGLLDQRFKDAGGNPIGDITFGGLEHQSNPDGSEVVDSDDASPIGTAGLTAGGFPAQPNITLGEDDFPFHRLADPLDRDSAIEYTTNDVASSPGTRFGSFITAPRNARERCENNGDDVFNIMHGGGKLDVRRVEPRNTPTTINAVFNFRNFWDGRANNVFNGVDPFGRRTTTNDPSAGIVLSDNRKVDDYVTQLELHNGSLASQAVGPPLSSFEMSCENRTFADIGVKVLLRRALRTQVVHPDDSLFGHPGPHGDLRYSRGDGLRYTYRRLVQNAFKRDLWEATGRYRIEPDGKVVRDRYDGYSQMELNFSFFWGIAIMAYEATLISDDSPFDRYCGSSTCDPDGEGDASALSDQEKLGLAVFTGKGKCVNCHDGPEFSKAATHLQPENQEEGLVERMFMSDDGIALYDNGFYNIGVQPSLADIGLGGEDPHGVPLSFTRQYLDILRGNNVPDPFQVDPCTFEVPFDPSDCSIHPDPDAERVAVDGAFKTPILRNVGLTPPYFHNGGSSTLEQVVEFYNRGGDRRSKNDGDTSGTGPLGQGGHGGSNLDPDITDLELTQEEQEALVAFMLALTDQRVACEAAPFDHPALTIPNGHQNADANGDGEADPIFVTLPAVGEGGLPDEGLACLPNTGNLFDMQGLLTP